MYPFIHVGSMSIGTFGLFLWLAAVAGGYVLYLNFVRDGVDADAVNIVALVVLSGVLGAKLWHELQDIGLLKLEMQNILHPGWAHAGQVVMRFLEFMRGGIAWYGGLLAGIGMLMWQGKLTRPNGLTGWRASIRMLDLAAPATPIGYGVGRIGCLMSGDGDYGRNTTSHFWGVHMAKDAIVPPHPADALVLATPIWEFGIALLIAWTIWVLGVKARPLGWLTGLYLVLSGISRFLIEFWRINPRLYINHTLTNAQMASIGSILAGVLVMLFVSRHVAVGGAVPASVLQTEGQAL
jgi:phosphatidylglycerol---prolipoprotein diacylglyceryl transferase